MRLVVLLSVLLMSITTFAQKGITFEVEKLEKPEKTFPETSINDIYRTLIFSDAREHSTPINATDFPYRIIAQSNAPSKLVSFSYHSFFYGMYQAYADHRPFVLSPDMIWLLISQGFTRHINANQEELRKYFVDFSEKMSLVIEAEKSYEDSELSWEALFPEFTKQIGNHVGNKLIETLSCNFSTTTSIEKLASEATIMEAMKPYFEFVVLRVVCGIPEITLEGTTEDWEKVLTKAQALKEYELDWWITELEPILKEFIKTSKGQVDKAFWQNMFKAHSQEQYGARDRIDGWFVRFFPYDKEGKRNDLKELMKWDNLPNEIVKVDFKFVTTYNDTTIVTPLELWAGFIGLQQNPETFALRPQIGWMIREKDMQAQERLLDKLKEDSGKDSFFDGLILKVEKFPTELLSLESIKKIEISFTKDIKIPDEFAKVKVEKLILNGVITDKEIERIKKMFPKSSMIKINGEIVQGEDLSHPKIHLELLIE